MNGWDYLATLTICATVVTIVFMICLTWQYRNRL